MKLPETLALLSDIFGNSLTSVEIEEISPILEEEMEQQNNSIKFDDLALWALERLE